MSYDGRVLTVPFERSRQLLRYLQNFGLLFGMALDKKKYDRQIRIWGAHGQEELQSARVCLLHAGPTGSETLKNLVLGGIAAFTIVDEVDVSHRLVETCRD